MAYKGKKYVMRNFEPIDKKTEIIAKDVVDSAFTVYSKLGPGMLEKIYEICLCHELDKRRLRHERQIKVPVHYDNMNFEEGLRLDVLVENCIVCEIKAIENVNPVWDAQIISQLNMTGKRLGFLINFNTYQFKGGIRRFVV